MTDKTKKSFILVHRSDGRPYYIRSDLIGAVDIDVMKNTCIHTIFLADGVIKVKETMEDIIKMLYGDDRHEMQ